MWDFQSCSSNIHSSQEKGKGKTSSRKAFSPRDLEVPLINSGLYWWLRRSRICPQCWRPGFDPWDGKITWRRKWQPTPVFFPGESPQTKKPGGLQSMESQSVRRDWATKHKHTYQLYLHPSGDDHTHSQKRLENFVFLPGKEKIWGRESITLSCFLR